MKNLTKILLMLTLFTMPMIANAGEGHGNMSKGMDHSKMNMESVGKSELKKVEQKYVCMVNNMLFDKVQIPTIVNGKTYYGCCSMCKAKLERSEVLRMAIDPVSKNKVDKATAIIGAEAGGAVHYFENEENLKKFTKNANSG